MLYYIIYAYMHNYAYTILCIIDMFFLKEFIFIIDTCAR